MCKAKRKGGRRCPSHTPEARRAGRVVDAAQRRLEASPPGSSEAVVAEAELVFAQEAYRDLVKAIRDAREFVDGYRRAAEDAASFDLLLISEPPGLRRELAMVGLHGLAHRYGFDHRTNLQLMLTPVDLADMPLPHGVSPPPQPDPFLAGPVRVAVRPSAWPTADEARWHPLIGLRLLWDGDGDPEARRQYLYDLSDWLMGFFARFSPTPSGSANSRTP